MEKKEERKHIKDIINKAVTDLLNTQKVQKIERRSMWVAIETAVDDSLTSFKLYTKTIQEEVMKKIEFVSMDKKELTLRIKKITDYVILEQDLKDAKNKIELLTIDSTDHKYWRGMYAKRIILLEQKIREAKEYLDAGAVKEALKKLGNGKSEKDKIAKLEQELAMEKEQVHILLGKLGYPKDLRIIRLAKQLKKDGKEAIRKDKRASK